ncbi:MAG: hypothetical protein LBM98_09405 [Oscillospiraceae bacterium]|jgi:hypothetical protein|nr:hypothetical protein [Oscillospiraceae bacterium]
MAHISKTVKDGRSEFEYEYEGEIQNGEPQGQGRLTLRYHPDFKLSYTYEGQFKNGELHGKGKKIHKFTEGNVYRDFETLYEGEFRNGELNGAGRILESNGNCEEGIFQNGKLHGKGRAVRGDEILEGNFDDGALISGKVNYGNGNSFEGDNPLNGDAVGTYIYKTGEIYSGTFKSMGHSSCDLRDGAAKITYADGKIYEGVFRTIKDCTCDIKFLYGKGKITFPDGEIWDGEFKANKLISGTVTFAGGEVHALTNDDYYDDKLSGKGELKNDCGDIYYGEFRGGALFSGEIIYADGLRQEVTNNEYRTDKLFGIGTVKNTHLGYSHFEYYSKTPHNLIYNGKFENGDFISGEMRTSEDTVWLGKFADGLLTGKGRIHSESLIVFDGDFIDGCPEGSGIARPADIEPFDANKFDADNFEFPIGDYNSEYYCVGETQNGYFTKGKVRRSKYGDTEELEFTGKFSLFSMLGGSDEFSCNGKGTITYPDGTILEGEFEEDWTYDEGGAERLNGEGKIIKANGDIYEGEFDNQRLNGYGKITYADGRIVEGEFDDGDLVEAEESD